MASLIMTALSWSTDASSVRQILGPQPTRLELSSGNYAIYEDPGGDEVFPLPMRYISVEGPNGRVLLRTHSSNVAINDIAAVFLGTGLFTPIADFSVSKDTTYAITITGQPANAKVLAGYTYSGALNRVLPWLVGLLVSITVEISGIILIRKVRSKETRVL